MGLRESKIVLDALSEAYASAEQSRKNKIEVDLCQPFIESLQQLWCNIPSAAQELIIGKTGGKEGTTPKRRRKLPKHNHLPIPHDGNLLSKVPAWKQKPLMFFEIGQRKLMLTENPVEHVRNYMVELNERKGMDIVRFRLLQVVFHRLKSDKFGATRLRSNNAKSFAHVLSLSGICGNTEDAENEVSSWADQGKKIDGLCLALGSVQQVGYSHLAHLFFLQDIADTTIKELSQHGETWDETIQILKSRNEVSDEDRLSLEGLANILMDAVWKQVEKSISRSNLGWELRQIEFRRNPTPTFVHQQTNTTLEASSPVPSAELANLPTDISVNGTSQSRPLCGNSNTTTLEENPVPSPHTLSPFDTTNETWNMPHSLLPDEPQLPSSVSSVQCGQSYNAGSNIFAFPTIPSDSLPPVLDETDAPWAQSYNAGSNIFEFPPPILSNSLPSALDEADAPWAQSYNAGSNIFEFPPPIPSDSLPPALDEADAPWAQSYNAGSNVSHTCSVLQNGTRRAFFTPSVALDMARITDEHFSGGEYEAQSDRHNETFSGHQRVTQGIIVV